LQWIPSFKWKDWRRNAGISTRYERKPSLETL
jgi:hypothetical protein